MNNYFSFLHSGYPGNCVAPLILSGPSNIDFPAMAGTGFFARRGRRIYFVTAKHCLSNLIDVGDQNWDSIISTISLPFDLNGSATGQKHYVQFSQAISVESNHIDIPGNYLDVVFLEIDINSTTNKQEKELLRKAIKLPHTGEWLESFEKKNSNLALKTTGLELTALGFPYVGSSSKIEYPAPDAFSSERTYYIHMQPCKITGSMENTGDPDRLKFICNDWGKDMGGFSGSPVIIGFKNGNGNQYMLAGMLVTGGANSVAYFLKVSYMMKAFVN
ncbi:MAG: hypothetical protein Q8R65_00330 [Polynucleobacter sp.]|nr:hypothetical protein [Polynucleobacter sp.]